MAAKLNTKLNYQPKEEDDRLAGDEPDQTFRKFEEELEINDFPQQARWRVTSKVSIIIYSTNSYIACVYFDNLSHLELKIVI